MYFCILFSTKKTRMAAFFSLSPQKKFNRKNIDCGAHLSVISSYYYYWNLPPPPWRVWLSFVIAPRPSKKVPDPAFFIPLNLPSWSPCGLTENLKTSSPTRKTHKKNSKINEKKTRLHFPLHPVVCLSIVLFFLFPSLNFSQKCIPKTRKSFFPPSPFPSPKHP